MRVLVVGGGGREHAIVARLAQSPDISALYCAPGNAGIAELATCVPLAATDLDGVCGWVRQNAIDYVVVAPDDPLCLGMVDRLAAIGVPAFGPNRAAARIEGSKAFAKELMRKHHIPTARYQTFDALDAALQYVRSQPAPLVVKADGLALGKGVLICQSTAEAEAAVTDMLAGGKFGASGRRVVIEELLTGPEVSVLCFTDGETLRPMPSGMDHKRALDGDLGLNTGGMGVIAPNPYYTPQIADQCLHTIFQPTLAALRAEGCPFRGCLYFGLMLTADGPKVIEYNCRFGDPEAQAMLPLLQSDLFAILRATTEGALAETPVKFADGACACIILASGGYPEKYATGKPITGIEQAEETAAVYHAGTKRGDDGALLTAGGRVLGVSATADTLSGALQAAYGAAEKIRFEGAHMRRDIGKRALEALR